jgi:uncharacterized protein YdiU (UPF0061 family)
VIDEVRPRIDLGGRPVPPAISGSEPGSVDSTMATTPASLEHVDLDLTFDNRFTAELPADPMDLNRPRQVHHAAYSRVSPTPTADPTLLAHSQEVANMLGFDDAAVASPEFVQAFSGNALVDGMDTHAACYGGHQFGNWAGQLGDGRAITLGEVVGADGNHHMLQLKGAGPTPYSRTADGLAVLRSSVREFLCSEAMHHLGVPTTRALSLCTTGDQVMRDMFYDGRAALEPGAVVCRVAPSFIRFGSFEIFAAREEYDELRALADHAITHHFPHIAEAGMSGPDAYVAMLREVIARTVEMVVHWQRVGFVHGVMNTDNMSIHGLTIDYGPYGWLEDYDPDWTPNTTDAAGKRYRYGYQPPIAQWNLMRLANALHPLVGAVEPLQEALDSFVTEFDTQWHAMIASKLGLEELTPADDEGFIEQLFETLQATETDMTLFYRGLANVPSATETTDGQLLEPLLDAYYLPEELAGDTRSRVVAWLRAYTERVRHTGVGDPERKAAMDAVNPLYVLRNYLAQLAIDDATAGNPGLITELHEVLRWPYTARPEADRFAEKRPDWARTRPGCSMLSCSS